MNMKLLAALAASSVFALTACSDDPAPTLADKCATVTEDCLVGAWTLQAITTKTDLNTPLTSFTSAPGTLTFNDNGTFQYHTSGITTNAACQNVDNYGKWSLEGTSVKLRTTNGDCIGEMTTLTPTITVESGDAGDKATMNIGKVFFQQDENTSMDAANTTEVFTRAE